MDKRRNNFFLFGVISFCISIFLLAIVVQRCVEVKKFIASSVETEGVIVDYVENETTDTKGRAVIDYYPIIKYTDLKGNSRSFKSSVTMNYETSIFKEAKDSGSTSTQFHAPRVKVLYCAVNPGDARPARTFFDIWGDMIIMTIIAVAVSFVGCALIWFHYESKAEEKKARLDKLNAR